VYDAIDPLLRAMRANPKDFAPRLAYADVLDDLGHTAAATFLRAHCAVYQLPVWHQDRRAHTVRAPLEVAMAAGEVFPAGKVYIDPSTLDLKTAAPWGGLSVYRGLIDQFSGTLDDWVRGADILLRWHPVRSARVGYYPDSESLVVANLGDSRPRELTVAVPGERPLGPVPIPDGDAGIRAALARLVGDRWPSVKFRLEDLSLF
jgi:uncharacterized protein (TIGR02996 family)